MGFGLFSLLEYGIAGIIDKVATNIKSEEERRDAAKNNMDFYYDTAKKGFVQTSTGRKCTSICEYSKYGYGYYKDVKTGEILGYFGKPNPNYEKPSDRSKRLRKEAEELLKKYRED